MLALLYDIHGNLVALEEVLKDAEAAGANGYLLGGDFASWSPWPRETIERLRGLPSTTWIRGNGERWLREPPADRPEVLEALSEHDSGLGTDEGWLYSLQAQFEQDGVYDKTVVFGHSHQQFSRPGPNGTTLVNPGSAGMPLDGDVRAAYALRR